MRAEAGGGAGSGLRDEARVILRSLEAEVLPLIPEDRAAYWKEYLETHRDRYLDIVSFLEAGDRGKRILEIGSVPGHFTVLLKKLGFDVEGVDVDPARMRRVWDEYGIPVRKADIETAPLPFPDEAFDIVIFTEVLEHLRINLLFTMRELRRVLKRGGRLLLSTPNITPVQRLNFFLGGDYQGNIVEEFRKLEDIGHMGHIRLYSLNDIRRLLDHVGLGITLHAYRGKRVPLRAKGKLLWLLHPRKESFRGYLYVIASRDGGPEAS